MSMFALFMIFLGCGFSHSIYLACRRRLVMLQGWDSVISRVESVNLRGIQSVAECSLASGGRQLQVQTLRCANCLAVWRG